MVRRRLVGIIMILVLTLSGLVTPVDGCGSPFVPENNEYVGPGKHETELYIINKSDDSESEALISAGKVAMWNTREEFIISLETIDNWQISELRIYVGSAPIPISAGGTPKIGMFPYIENFSTPVSSYELALNLVDDLEFSWGRRDKDESIQNVAICAKVVNAENGSQLTHEEAWAHGEKEFETRSGWWSRYSFDHPKTGHFIDAPVAGMKFETPSHKGHTNDSGAFDYITGEDVKLYIGSLYIGSAKAKHKVTPMDLVGTDNLDDERVINMARLLQSLDVDADPRRGISITEPVIESLEQAMAELNITELDFLDRDLVDTLIVKTVEKAEEMEGISLNIVSAKDARDNLEKGTSGGENMFRKNISKTPELDTTKAKLEIMPIYVPSQKANGDFVDLHYTDEDEPRSVAKPLIVVYTDQVEGTGGASDIFAAVSRDEGNTWKRTNISRSADKSSFTLDNGIEYPGDVKKPQVRVKDNKILIAWTSKYAHSGKPKYAIDQDDDYPFDDPFWEDDIWGVSGPQRSCDYAELGHEDVGEIPFSCVWTCRGIIDKENGEIVWYKPERLTSGRRDAFQLMMNGAPGAGFALTWQEDPEGLRPGEQAGPGEGWSGATTNHKTDIWYSYILWEDFNKIDTNFVSGGASEHDDDVDDEQTGRVKALVPFSLPVRVSDNDTLNSDNMKATFINGEWIPETDETGKILGSHRYGYEIDGLCADFYDKTNNQDEPKNVCITEDGRLLDGDTGASRPNIMLQPYKIFNEDGTVKKASAWVIMCYEETKGVGAGPPDTLTESTDLNSIGSLAASEPETGEGKGEGTDAGTGAQKGKDGYFPDNGKNVIYHTFDLANPDLVSAGTILNPQATTIDENGETVPLYLVDEEGNDILDWNGELIPAYENARRPRFIVQSKGNVGESRTVLVALFKMGEEGKGRPSDIFMRRWVVPTGDKGNPYRTQNLEDIENIQNISSVTPTEIWVNTDSSSKNRDSIKVLRWDQTEDNLHDPSWENPYDDARAHRGFIRGDFLAIAYDWTPNWAAARNGNDVFNLYIRRSFDGGATWTTMPAEEGGEGVWHTDIYKTATTHEYHDKVEVETFYGPGNFEPARNVSQIMNTKESVIEPRLVGVPGNIKTVVEGEAEPIFLYPEDQQDTNVFWVTYGTESNPGKSSDEIGKPLDVYYSYSDDKGESYYTKTKTINPDGKGNHAGEVVEVWDWLAKDTGKKEAEQAECQIRMTPDGTIFYAVWNENSEEGSDVIFRRMTTDGSTVEVSISDPLEGPDITVTGITDREITSDDVTITVTATGDDTTINLTCDGQAIPFNSGDTIALDGAYRLTVSSTKTAENLSTTEIVDFTIDKNAPEITITGIDNGQSYNDDVTPVISLMDNHSITSNIVSLVELNEEVFVSGTTVSGEGTYTLIVTATDEAGNESTVTYAFSITNPPNSGDSSNEDSEDNEELVGGITANIKHIQLTELTTADNKLRVSIPALATSEDTTITITPIEKGQEMGSGMIKIGNRVYQIEIKDANGNNITKFSKQLTIEYNYSDVEIPQGTTEDDLKMCYWDEKEKMWIVVPTTVDTTKHKIITLTDHLTIYAVMAAPDFPTLEDIKGHWAEKYVYKIISMGIASGNPNGTFSPEDKISREEFAKLIAGINELQPDSIQILTFSDTQYIADWARGFVAALVKEGIVKGYPDNTFKPTRFITRAEAALMIVRALYKELPENSYMSTKDADSLPEWALPYISKAVEEGIMFELHDGTFGAGANLTRAQAAEMICRMIDAKEVE